MKLALAILTALLCVFLFRLVMSKEAGEEPTAAAEKEMRGQAKETRGQAKETRGQAKDTRGQAKETRGQAKETRGQAKETRGQAKETRGQAKETRGQAKDTRGQAKDTRGQAKETRGQAKETRGQAKETQDQAKVGPGAKQMPQSAVVKANAGATQRPSTASPTYLSQVLQRGKFQKVENMLSVAAGDTLELRCKGNPVQWGVPTYLQEDNEGRLRMVQHQRYGTLILANSTGADTGEYTCYPMYCEDTDCRKEYDKAVKVFIFFPDPQELFVPSSEYYEVIQLRSNRPAVLPCQVTSPGAKVTLHREYPPAEVEVDGVEISYSVTRGFTIHRPRPHLAGSLYCMASLGRLRQSSTTYMLVYVHYPAAPPSPVIRASSETVALGQNLELTCTVVGDENVLVDFTWVYPGQKIDRPLYTQETVQVEGHARQQRSQSVLLVDEVRDVDQGTYTCTAQNLEGSRSASTTISVLTGGGGSKPERPRERGRQRGSHV
ncbi:platelet-derived growth factor receptor-like protein [Brachyhypopomus gauderio]|uniref:platelet-derived growth factor receptor-like protein n=1 Tax=Brachyhypopomus gauderio TaxID=698409 RepID=UPI004041BB5E